MGVFHRFLQGTPSGPPDATTRDPPMISLSVRASSYLLEHQREAEQSQILESGSRVSASATSPSGEPQPPEVDIRPSVDYSAGSSSNTTVGGFFPNGSGFYFHKPVMKEVHEHHGPSVLQEMAKYIIPGAEFDSSERDDPPRCHPDTRTDFIEQLQTQIHNSILGTRIIWLVGPAGVGKSAIMQSLAETVCPLPTMRCATLFFSRPNHRDDPKKVFTTLAYGLAVADPDYRHYIGEKIATDPGFLDKSLDEQFKRLFVAPFTTGGVSVGFQNWVVFLDGFDEIDGERDQCRLLGLIRESLSLPTQATPFIWIIASRPEAHLQASFRRVEEKARYFLKLEIPIDSEEALRSVERYLHTEFTRIRHDYSDIVPSLWPSENDFLQLTKASSGLFIFASTLVDYVGKENPVLRLKYIICLIGQITASRQEPSYEVERNPFHALDILYTTIMSDIPSDALPATKTILGFYLLGDDVGEYRNLLVVCNILGLEQHAVYAALRKLHSVLTVPSPDKAHEEPVRFLHASFSDFLKDRSRSQSFYVDSDHELMKIWRCYANVVKLAPVEALSDHITLSWEPPSTVEKGELRKLIQKRAQRFWFIILIRSCHDPSCQHVNMRHRLTPDTAELVEIFEKLGSELFERKRSESRGDDMASFCGWLLSHAPVTFRRRVISREYGLMQLTEHDLDNMFRGLWIRKWGFYHLRSHYFDTPIWRRKRFDLQNLSIDQWNRTKRLALDQNQGVSWETRPLNWSVLANLLILQRKLDVEQSLAVKVTIVRIKPTEHYAVIGPLRLAIYNVFDLEYLVFPYVEGQN